MKKHKENPGAIAFNSINLSRDAQKTYNIDQNFRKNQNSNVMDLVTHKQKQIQKKKYRLGAKQKHISDSEDQLYSSNQNNYQFQEENGANANNNRYRSKDVDKDKLLGVINRLVAKNKINSKIAFDIPILSVEDFAMYDDGVRGDIAWNKMSSILENDYKIYGVRVDSIVQYVKKMSDSLGRKDAHDNQTKQKQVKQLKEAKDAKEQKQRQKTIKLSQLMSSKQNLTAYLQKNSESLDINLRTKLMMRKDPIFERTSRIFDYSSYSSFFMNTLSLRKGLFMQINANSQEQGTSQMKSKQIDQIQLGQKLSEGENCQKYSNLIEQTLKIKPDFQVRKSIEKFTLKLEQFGVTLFPQDLKEEENNINYLKIINMIMSGHLATAFQVGVRFQYDSQSSIYEQKEEDQIISEIKSKKIIQIYDEECDKMEQNVEQRKKNENENENEQPLNLQIQIENKDQKQEKNEMINQSSQIEVEVGVEDERRMVLSEQKKDDLEPVIINTDMDQEKETQQMLDKKNKQILKQKMNKKTRKIKEVINIKKNEQRVNVTRNKGLSKEIRCIIKGEKRSITPKVLKQKELFDATIKQNFKRVLKKEKILHTQASNIFDSYQERNLIKLLREYEFQLKNPLQLRPAPTKEELKKQKQKAKLVQYEKNAISQGQSRAQNIIEQNKQQIVYKTVQKTDPIIKMNNNVTEPMNNVPAKNEQISESEDEQLIQKRQINNHRNQTITNVKQNIYGIMKIQKSTDFQSLVKQYTKKYGNLSPATVFIAMLHLSNERFIKTIQFGKKNFKVILSDL